MQRASKRPQRWPSECGKKASSSLPLSMEYQADGFHRRSAATARRLSGVTVTRRAHCHRRRSPRWTFAFGVVGEMSCQLVPSSRPLPSAHETHRDRPRRGDASWRGRTVFKVGFVAPDPVAATSRFRHLGDRMGSCPQRSSGPALQTAASPSEKCGEPAARGFQRETAPSLRPPRPRSASPISGK